MQSLSAFIAKIEETAEINTQEIQTPELFLQLYKNRTLIEILLDTEQPDIKGICKILQHYASLIERYSSDTTMHRIALEKYVRLVCMYVFKKYSIDDISAMRNELREYFPFYYESDNESNKVTMLEHAFDSISYQIMIGNAANADLTFNDQFVQKMKDSAQHPFFETPKSSTAKVINVATQGVGAVVYQIPGLSWAANTMGNMGYTLAIHAAQHYTLLAYAERMSRLSDPSLKDYNFDQKKQHIELLAILYWFGPQDLSEEIISQFNKIINDHANAIPFLTTLLKTIAPEPLGMGWYALHARDILSQLSEDSAKILLSSLPNVIDGKYDIFKKKLTLKKFNFSVDNADVDEWIIYFLSMAKLPDVKDIMLFCTTLTERQRTFLLYLMGSEKLIVIFPAFSYELTLCPLPVKSFFYTHGNINIMTQITQALFKNGLSQMRFYHVDPNTDLLKRLLQDTKFFENVSPSTSVMHRVARLDPNQPSFTFQSFFSHVCLGKDFTSNDSVLSEWNALLVDTFETKSQADLQSVHSFNRPIGNNNFASISTNESRANVGTPLLLSLNLMPNPKIVTFDTLRRSR